MLSHLVWITPCRHYVNTCRHSNSLIFMCIYIYTYMYSYPSMPYTPLNLPLPRQTFIYLCSLQSVSIDRSHLWGESPCPANQRLPRWVIKYHGMNLPVNRNKPALKRSSILAAVISKKSWFLINKTLGLEKSGNLDWTTRMSHEKNPAGYFP